MHLLENRIKSSVIVGTSYKFTEQEKDVMGLIFWYIPVVSLLYVSTSFYLYSVCMGAPAVLPAITFYIAINAPPPHIYNLKLLFYNLLLLCSLALIIIIILSTNNNKAVNYHNNTTNYLRTRDRYDPKSRIHTRVDYLYLLTYREKDSLKNLRIKSIHHSENLTKLKDGVS